jgi:hypothetical protein
MNNLPSGRAKVLITGEVKPCFGKRDYYIPREQIDRNGAIQERGVTWNTAVLLREELVAADRVVIVKGCTFMYASDDDLHGIGKHTKVAGRM